jgi:Fic family protein
MAPPFRITPLVLASCAKVERSLGRCEGLGGTAPTPQLRRANRIRTVQATTAVEGNTLSVEQVTAVFDGKRVRGPAREVLEVENALTAYELAAKLDPRSERDVLRAHAVLMKGLAPDAGRYRRGEVGIVKGSRVTHVAPPAARVPTLMKDLFAFAAADDHTPPLVSACVLHYELEFIHPFSDGNGRVGRWWQHALLCRYSPVFAHVPTESMIKAHQSAYYAALARSDRAGDATTFIEFMLAQLHAALELYARECRPARLDAAARLELAREHFGRSTFSRRDYLALHRALSQATASRDLRGGVERGSLRIEGDKATARYTFTARGKRKRGA